MKTDIFSSAHWLTASGWWTFENLTLYLGADTFVNIVTGTCKWILYRGSRFHYQLWMAVFFFRAHKVSVGGGGKEGFLHGRSSSPTKQTTFDSGNICNKKQRWCGNKLHICLHSAFNPPWGRQEYIYSLPAKPRPCSWPSTSACSWVSPVTTSLLLCPNFPIFSPY